MSIHSVQEPGMEVGWGVHRRAGGRIRDGQRPNTTRLEFWKLEILEIKRAPRPKLLQWWARQKPLPVSAPHSSYILFT